MVWLRVQRSGRTSIRATTRSLSASVKVTPFNSAKGIFIELTFSSGVIIGGPMFIDFVISGWSEQPDPESRDSGFALCALRNDGSIFVKKVLETITFEVKPAITFTARDKRFIIRHMLRSCASFLP